MRRHAEIGTEVDFDLLDGLEVFAEAMKDFDRYHSPSPKPPAFDRAVTCYPFQMHLLQMPHDGLEHGLVVVVVVAVVAVAFAGPGAGY